MKLPGELRLQIYELLFSSDHLDVQTIDISDQSGRPASDLLATCSKVYNDAKPTYDRALKVFLGREYHYCTTIDHAKSLEWNYAREMSDACAGKGYLPCARSLTVKLTCPSIRGPKSFSIRRELDGAEEPKARICDVVNCNERIMTRLRNGLASELQYPLSRRVLLNTDGSLHVNHCLDFAFHAIDDVTEGEGFGGFWQRMENKDQRDELPALATVRRLRSERHG